MSKRSSGFAGLLSRLLRPVRQLPEQTRPHDPKTYIQESFSLRGRFWVTGWVVDDGHPVRPVVVHGEHELVQSLQYPLPSEHAAQLHGPEAATCGFEITGDLPDGVAVDELDLVVHRRQAQAYRRDRLYIDRIDLDAYHKLEKRFWDAVGDRRLLELGSRARSGITRRDKHAGAYTGVDILAGENVDLVGDAHELSTVVGDSSFEAVYAVSVFEHLLMPWKAAIEINKVLDMDGLVFIGTHQTYPMHDVPWDYWRFSDTSWHALFNVHTGFEIVATAMGEEARIVPLHQHSVTRKMSLAQGFLLSGVLARKVGDTSLRWDVPLGDLTTAAYPE